MAITHDNKSGVFDLPLYVDESVSFANVLRKQAEACDKDKEYIVWKCGRTSHFTYGLTSEIKTDYLWKDGVTVSDEWMIKDPLSREVAFSANGDSGSFVFDNDGKVSGLLWGGLYDTFVTFVTPIETVFEDIKAQTGAKEVKIVCLDT